VAECVFIKTVDCGRMNLYFNNRMKLFSTSVELQSDNVCVYVSVCFTLNFRAA